MSRKEEEHGVAGIDLGIELGKLRVHFAPRQVLSANDVVAEPGERRGDRLLVVHGPLEGLKVIGGVDADDQCHALSRQGERGEPGDKKEQNSQERAAHRFPPGNRRVSMAATIARNPLSAKR
jgi:hypothetical protein